MPVTAPRSGGRFAASHPRALHRCRRGGSRRAEGALAADHLAAAGPSRADEGVGSREIGGLSRGSAPAPCMTDGAENHPGAGRGHGVVRGGRSLPSPASHFARPKSRIFTVAVASGRRSPASRSRCDAAAAVGGGGHATSCRALSSVGASQRDGSPRFDWRRAASRPSRVRAGRSGASPVPEQSKIARGCWRGTGRRQRALPARKLMQPRRRVGEPPGTGQYAFDRDVAAEPHGSARL